MKRCYSFFVLLFVLCASFFAVGNASWTISNTNTGNAVQTTGPDCTVSFNYLVDEPTFTEDVEKKETYSDRKSQSDDAKKNYETILQIYNNKQIGNSSGGVSDSKAEKRSSIKNGLRYDYSFTWLCTWTEGWIFKTTYYSCVGTVRVYNIQNHTVNKGRIYFCKAVKNSTITQPKLTYSGYTLSGFYSDEALTKEFDFSTKITGDTSIYVRWLEDTTSSTGLSSYINGIGNSTTGNVYSGTDANYDVSTDSSYVGTTKSIYLDTCTINQGTTINFDMNNGDTDVEAREGEKISTISTGDNTLVLSQTKLNYQVILTGDLTVNGTLTIGGTTGANGQNLQGLIVDSYVQLDLNGHNLIINNGGTVYSFGSIVDSKGTGNLIVKAGGILKTQIVLYGAKGGNSTIWGYGKGISPFEDYCLPYLPNNVKVEVTSSSSGNITVFTKLDLGRLGALNLYIPFIGSSSSYFLQLKPNNLSSNSYLTLTKIINSELKSKNNTNINAYRLYERLSFEFHSVSFSTNYISVKAGIHIAYDTGTLLGTITIEKDFNLALDRFYFPLSTTFSIYLYSSKWTIGQTLYLNPGTSITADSNSEIIFDYYKDSSGNAVEKKYDAVKVSGYGIVNKTLPASSHYISGGLIAVDYPISKSSFNSANYLTSGGFFGLHSGSYDEYIKRYQKASVNIYGTIRFKTGNNSSAPYILSGNININQWAIDSGNASKWEIDNLKNLSGKNVYLQTHSLTVQDAYYDWFESAIDMGNSSNSMSYCNASRWVSMFLTSNGVSYEVDTTKNNYYKGTTERQGGIFTAEGGQTYVLLTSTEYLLGNYDTQIDYNQTFTECTLDSSKRYFTIGDTNYIYYGGLTLPITSSDPAATSLTCNANKFSTQKAYTASVYAWQTGGYWKCTNWATAS